MVRKLIHDPLFLAQKSEPATKADKQVITDLKDTLQANLETCVGMAANMIGVKKNIIIVSFGFQKMIMVNAKIIRGKGPYPTEESCASLLGGPRKTTRYGEILVEYQDENFQPRRGTFIGWTAQIIQHELDHVNGILI
jgi:peptide deformylase